MKIFGQNVVKQDVPKQGRSLTLFKKKSKITVFSGISSESGGGVVCSESAKGMRFWGRKTFFTSNLSPF